MMVRVPIDDITVKCCGGWVRLKSLGARSDFRPEEAPLDIIRCT